MGLVLPRTFTLPSGARVRIHPEPALREAEGLFADAVTSATLTTPEGAAVDVLDLAIEDFHVVRAILTKAGYLVENEVDLDCHNCGAAIEGVRPCAGLETGPFEDGELDDPELDQLLEPGVPHAIAPIALGRARVARSVTLAARTVRESLPLHRALERDPFVVDADVVAAMGIVALGRLEDAARIASVLDACDDAGFGRITDVFLQARYPLRLACDVFCPTCKARNTVDAPALREFEPGSEAPRSSTGVPLAPLDTFVDRAHAIFEPLVVALAGERPELVVENGTPAVDDGGEPLFGSYEPPPPADAPVPTRPPRITVYYRTFEAIEREEGSFDWDEELRETLEHELEHHGFWLHGGTDPMDDDERAEIAREVVRVVGREETARRTFAAFRLSLVEFVVRAWPLILIAVAVLVLTLAEGRCGE